MLLKKNSEKNLRKSLVFPKEKGKMSIWTKRKRNQSVIDAVILDNVNDINSPSENPSTDIVSSGENDQIAS